MKTTMTLGEIRSYSPCILGWEKLVAACGTSADDHVVDLRDILKSNGPRDAWWSTRCLPRRERVALALRAAWTVEHLSPAAKKCNDATERWLRGEATDAELNARADSTAWAARADSAARAARAAELASAAWAAWAVAEARAAGWYRLGEIMQQWCDEQDTDTKIVFLDHTFQQWMDDHTCDGCPTYEKYKGNPFGEKCATCVRAGQVTDNYGSER